MIATGQYAPDYCFKTAALKIYLDFQDNRYDFHGLDCRDRVMDNWDKSTP